MGKMFFKSPTIATMLKYHKRQRRKEEDTMKSK
jgi:hypothetical protein